MKVKTTILISFLLVSVIGFGQKNKTPKNLKKAVSYLHKHTSDSLKTLIQNTENDNLKKISYPWGGKFKTIFNWTKKDNYNSRIKKYLSKKGVSYHQVQVILIAFKQFLNNNEFNEKEIIKPFKIIELKWKKEDEVRFTTDSLRGVYIPKDLNDCFVQIDKFWHDSTKVKVKNWTEDEFSAKAHFGFGRWMRNNWQLWGGSRLKEYFKNKDIHHPDDMSGIILDSYHRYLNNKEIDLEKQITFYKNYWEESEKAKLIKDKEEFEELKLEFLEYEVGDTLEFNYNHGFANQTQEDKYMDDSCLAMGILIDKNETNLNLKIKVIDACSKKGIVYYNNEEVRIYNKKSKKWKRPKKKVIKFLKKGKSRWFNFDDWELL